MSKEKVERAHALVSQVISNDLNVVAPNLQAVRATLCDVKACLEECLGMVDPPQPRDALRPVDAPLESQESMFAGEDAVSTGGSNPELIS